jgi:hypothetical protein
MEPFDGLDLRFSKRWKGLRERYFIRRGLNWYGDNTNQRVNGIADGMVRTSSGGRPQYSII